MARKTEFYGDVLRRERKKAGLSSREVARRAGISEGQVRYIETGMRETKPKTLVTLARALGIDEKPLLEDWLLRNIPQIGLPEIESNLPRKVTITELKTLFGIPDAEETFSKYKNLTVSDAGKLKPMEIVRMKKGLQSCLEFIHELNANQ